MRSLTASTLPGGTFCILARCRSYQAGAANSCLSIAINRCSHPACKRAHWRSRRERHKRRWRREGVATLRRAYDEKRGCSEQETETTKQKNDKKREKNERDKRKNED